MSPQSSAHRFGAPAPQRALSTRRVESWLTEGNHARRDDVDGGAGMRETARMQHAVHAADAAATLVFDLDGTLADTAADLIEHPQHHAGARGVSRRCRWTGPATWSGPARGDAPARPRAGRPVGRPTSGSSALFRGFPRPLRREHRGEDEAVPGRRRPRSTASPRRASPRRLHQQDGGALGASAGGARRGRPLRRHLRARHLRLCQARRAAPHADRRAGRRRPARTPSWSATAAPTSTRPAAPACRSIAVSFGYTDTPVAQLGPDRVIDHFDALEAAEPRTPSGSPCRQSA